jgi:hypothetical protein
MGAILSSLGFFATRTDRSAFAAAIDFVMMMRLENLAANGTCKRLHFLDPLKVFHSSPNSTATHLPSR